MEDQIRTSAPHRRRVGEHYHSGIGFTRCKSLHIVARFCNYKAAALREIRSNPLSFASFTNCSWRLRAAVDLSDFNSISSSTNRDSNWAPRYPDLVAFANPSFRMPVAAPFLRVAVLARALANANASCTLKF